MKQEEKWPAYAYARHFLIAVNVPKVQENPRCGKKFRFRRIPDTDPQHP